MMGTKHTPGPWQVGTVSGHNAAIIHDAKDNGIATVYGVPLHTQVRDVGDDERWAEGMANARLIAAAPDMLEALKAIHHQLVKQDIKFGPLIADAEAVIAKATGE